MASQSIYELRNQNKRLKQQLTLKEGKIKNLENLIGVLNKRLERMAERLTGLAAERNELYAELKGAHRSIDFLERHEEELRTIRGSRP